MVISTRVVGTIAGALGMLGVLFAPNAVAELPPYWLSGALALIALVVLLAVAARLLWPSTSTGMQIWVCFVAVVFGGVVTWIAYIVSAFALQAHNLCNANNDIATPTVAYVVAGLVYVAIGAFGFQRPRRLPFLWALAGIAGAAVLFALTLAFPAAHGYCET